VGIAMRKMGLDATKAYLAPLTTDDGR
jgi:hypothetical protein